MANRKLELVKVIDNKDGSRKFTEYEERIFEEVFETRVDASMLICCKSLDKSIRTSIVEEIYNYDLLHVVTMNSTYVFEVIKELGE